MSKNQMKLTYCAEDVIKEFTDLVRDERDPEGNTSGAMRLLEKALRLGARGRINAAQVEDVIRLNGMVKKY